MSQLLRRALASARHRLNAPVLARLDELELRVAAVLDAVEALRADSEATSARAAGAVEQVEQQRASTRRIEAQVAHLEGLLGAGG